LKQNLNSSLGYRFGFVMYNTTSKPNIEEISDWNSIETSGYKIHTHPEVNVLRFETDFGTAILIGDAFVCYALGNVKDILEKMLREDNAWDEFDKLSGRFALILLSSSNVKILHDPFGSRTVYYREEGDFCASSHSSLGASLFNDKLSNDAKAFIKLPEYKQRGTGYLPGDLTMYDNIKTLIPNNYYDVASRKSVRYWPRKNIKPVTLDDFLQLCDDYFSKLGSYFAPRYKLLLGLTGGVDTRAVIAGLRGKGCDLRLVTWTGGRLPQKEVPVVETMEEHLDSPHFYMDPTKEVDSQKFMEIRKIANVATGYSRGGSRLTAHMSEVALPGEVFVRGFGGEILRGFYNRHKSYMSGNMVIDFSILYKTNKIKEPSDEFSSFVLKATKGFIQRANYDNNTYNLDLRDLFYWEQRMGAWGANMLNEMDPAMYSITGLNSRPLYEAAFGLPEKERLGAKLMLDITALYDKTFSEIGVVS